MSWQETLSRALWIMGPLLQAVLVWVMVRRRLHREFPLFLFYTVSHVVRFVLLFGLRGHQTAYFYSYWGAEAFDAILSLAILSSLFGSVLVGYPSVREAGRVSFRWMAAGLGVLALLAANAEPGADIVRTTAAILSLDRSVHIVQCGLLVFLFCFSRFLGLSWQDTMFGIALGFGLTASVGLVMASVRVQVGWYGDWTYSLLKPGSYNLAVVIWLTYLSRKQEAPVAAAAPANHQMKEWDRTLGEMLQR